MALYGGSLTGLHGAPLLAQPCKEEPEVVCFNRKLRALGIRPEFQS